ncbi:Fe2+-enterobactin ABC transporter substrate-binding protein [Tatumella sp. TA1]|uniref:Fe2+-enterobactin ABC transporter substrate-binding protein n=1 Tax=Rosenbergiella collisarenosi TaxID=1544695 RepID=UPI0008F8CC61|nr:Fe2+-enterobactin ABC transporter substrate-binding protein [Rosenbergiella collisarenosi]MBT0719774.1 Fe2+-enterobactin ABC transporter substrate-binding protein [Rosenbergiella collisarenosi]QGX90412.1 Fe2+-enterobactin ABC transporter substrate-binding protein [Tatumella sp. TA1]
MTRSSRLLTLLLVSVLLPFAGFSQAAGWPRQVVTDNGTVTLKSAPKRIVSTSVTLTGSLLAIGAPVIASGAGVPNSRFTDSQGFFSQWGKVAQQKHVQRLYIGEANAEMVAAQAPDLIVVSATGHDSALRLVNQLSSIAPVIVINYDNKSWQQVVTQLGQATGHEGQAQTIIHQFDQRVAELKPKLHLPPQPVSAFVWNGGGKEVNLWTADSAQGKLLEQLGFTLAPTPVQLATSHSMGQRKDIVQLSGEKMSDGLSGKSWLMFVADANTAKQVASDRFLQQAPAVKQGHVYPLGNDNFRLDYYSAGDTLAVLEKLFVQ